MEEVASFDPCSCDSCMRFVRDGSQSGARWTSVAQLVTENGHYGLTRNCNDLHEVWADPALWTALPFLRVCGSRSEAKGYAKRVRSRLGFALYPRDITGLTGDPRTKNGRRMRGAANVTG